MGTLEKLASLAVQGLGLKVQGSGFRVQGLAALQRSRCILDCFKVLDIACSGTQRTPAW